VTACGGTGVSIIGRGTNTTSRSTKGIGMRLVVHAINGHTNDEEQAGEQGNFFNHRRSGYSLANYVVDEINCH
jgi:hypothetical protein